MFYHKLVRYCEVNTEKGAFKLFLSKYTILDAIKDIADGWNQVPVSTIRKAFRKVIPRDKWNELAGNDFDGFGEEEPVQNISTHIPSDVIPGDVNCGQTVVTNAAFDTDIEEILHNLNHVEEGLFFDKSHVIEDVLLNPGPSDDNIDNIVCEVLQFQDVTGCEEDMTEVDNVQVDAGNIRAKIRKTCQRIQGLRFDQLTSAMPSHRYNEWRELLNKLENLTTACYDIIPVTSTVPATSSTDVVPSTSGINIAAAAAATSTTTSSTTITTTTTYYYYYYYHYY